MKSYTRYTLAGSIVMIASLFVPGSVVSTETEDTLTIGQRFHYETGFGESGFRVAMAGWGKSLPLYKKYEQAPKIKLPVPTFEGRNVERAIRERRSRRRFTDQPMTLEELAQILLSADGITHSDGSIKRAAPSAGALYPIDIYIAASGVISLENALYHFQVSDSSLELIKEGDLSSSLHLAANKQGAIGSSPCTIILTARFDRSTMKYADRGYRYAYLEAGAICQNIYLQVASLELGTCAVGAFNDDVLNELLEIDGVSEAALLLLPIGHY